METQILLEDHICVKLTAIVFEICCHNNLYFQMTFSFYLSLNFVGEI